MKSLSFFQNLFWASAPGRSGSPADLAAVSPVRFENTCCSSGSSPSAHSRRTAAALASGPASRESLVVASSSQAGMSWSWFTICRMSSPMVSDPVCLSPHSARSWRIFITFSVLPVPVTAVPVVVIFLSLGRRSVPLRAAGAWGGLPRPQAPAAMTVAKGAAAPGRLLR